MLNILKSLFVIKVVAIICTVWCAPVICGLEPPTPEPPAPPVPVAYSLTMVEVTK